MVLKESKGYTEVLPWYNFTTVLPFILSLVPEISYEALLAVTFLASVGQTMLADYKSYVQ
jgi:hypothetical protein